MVEPAATKTPAPHGGAAATQSDYPASPPNTGAPLRILLVDDHTIVRDGLKQILAKHFPQALFGEGRNAREALAAIEKNKWDVILLDLTMPGQSGLDVLK